MNVKPSDIMSFLTFPSDVYKAIKWLAQKKEVPKPTSIGKSSPERQQKYAPAIEKDKK